MSDDRYPKRAGHRGNSDTSIAGADFIAPVLPQLQAQVYGIVSAAGEKGATADEIAFALGWEKFRVRPRTSELKAAKRIVDSLQRRKSEAGVFAIVWTLPQFAPAPDNDGAAA